jgi:uncharacterized membrane protein
MVLVTILASLSVLFAGILAGAEFAIHVGVRAPAETLDARAQLLLRQALVRRLRVMIPTLFAPTLATGIASAALTWNSPGVWAQSVGLLGLLGWIGIRVIGTVPINSATLAWQAEAPPQDWQARVQRAERWHSMGVGAVVATFALFVVALALNLRAA